MCCAQERQNDKSLPKKSLHTLQQIKEIETISFFPKLHFSENMSVASTNLVPKLAKR